MEGIECNKYKPTAIDCRNNNLGGRMKIVNLIHIGDEVKNLDDMSPEERSEIARALNIQALKPLGYALSPAKDKTA